MRLLKTVLLSTTLMMGATFGADAAGFPLETELAATMQAKEKAFIETAQKFKENQTKVRARLLALAECYAGAIPITVDMKSKTKDIFDVVEKLVNILAEGSKKLESELATATGRMTEVEEANAALVRERDVAVADLASVRSTLNEVTEAELPSERADTATEDYIAIVKSTKEFKKTVVGGLLKIIQHFNSERHESLQAEGITATSDVAPVLTAVIKMIKGIKKAERDVVSSLTAAVVERDQFKSSLETQTGYLTDPEAVFARLTREKAAIEEALAEVAEAKAGVAGELIDAQDEVARLTAALEAAREAGEASSGVISEFSTELAAENESVRALSEKETELESEIQKLQLELRTLEKAKTQLVNAFATNALDDIAGADDLLGAAQ